MIQPVLSPVIETPDSFLAALDLCEEDPELASLDKRISKSHAVALALGAQPKPKVSIGDSIHSIFACSAGLPPAGALKPRPITPP